MLALIAGSTVDNFGDQLYPCIFEPLLRQLGVSEPLRLFALEPGSLPDGRRVDGLSAVRSAGASALLVGGGHVIRTDNGAIARDHLQVPMGKRDSSITRIRSWNYRRRRFLDGSPPWLPSDRWGAGEIPLGWVSVGLNELPSDIDTHRAVSQVAAAWIRTQHAADHAIAAGLNPTRVTVAPDLAFGIADVFDRDRLRQRGEAILKSVTGQTQGVAVVQAAPFYGWDAPTLRDVFAELKAPPFVFLPMGRYVREDLTLAAAAKALGRPCLSELSTVDVCAVLAAAGVVATTSMHAAIVAAALGRPVVSLGEAKAAPAFDACPEILPVTFADHTTAVDAIVLLNGADSRNPSERNAAAVRHALAQTLRALGVSSG